MPDKRVHRGAHPQDPQLFADAETNKLRQASEDLTWLLNRGYPKTSALNLVGNRFALRERQRIAVMRSTCDDKSRSCSNSSVN